VIFFFLGYREINHTRCTIVCVRTRARPGTFFFPYLLPYTLHRTRTRISEGLFIRDVRPRGPGTAGRDAVAAGGARKTSEKVRSSVRRVIVRADACACIISMFIVISAYCY